MIGITLGDPAGIGPEITLKAVAAMSREERLKTRIYGCLKTLLAVEAMVKSGVTAGEDVAVTDVAVEDGPLPFGKPDPRCGDVAFRSVEAAVKDASAGKIGCIVTAPLNKAALNAAGHHYDGHTGMLASLTGQSRAYMLLASERLNVIHVSTHVALRDAVAGVDPQKVLATIQVGYEHLKSIGITSPRIAVAGINPHCGEGGLFGDEDDVHIAPAVKSARELGIDVEGPISADTVFHRAYNGAFDLVVAQYHDQGHIPIKLVAFDTAVNVSLNLPIARTSVDHGTAFDIAGKGIADHGNLEKAIEYARKLSKGRGL